MEAVKVVFEVAQVKEPYEKYGKKFYPVSVKGLRSANGNYIFNCLVEIPANTRYVVGTLYSYNHNLYIKDVQPFEPKK